MNPRRTTPRSSEAYRLWFQFGLLFALVAAPMVCVMWFMAAAVRNERVVARQRLEEAYRAQLGTALAGLEAAWEKKAEDLTPARDRREAAKRFAETVEAGEWDSLIQYDSGGGGLYPSPTVSESGETAEAGRQFVRPPEWDRAERLEFAGKDAAKAAGLYARIADESTTPSLTAQALLAQARCLSKCGETSAALAILTETLAAPRLESATDAAGRVVALNGAVFAVELIREPSDERFRRIAARLAERLRNYADPDTPLMPSSQRLFLMRRLRELWPECPEFPTEEAEALALKLVAAGAKMPGGDGNDGKNGIYGKNGTAPADPTDPTDLTDGGTGARTIGRVAPTGVADVWGWTPHGKSQTALWSGASLRLAISRELTPRIRIPGASVVLLTPDQETPADPKGPAAILSVGDWMPGWRAGLVFSGADPLEAAAGKRIALYLAVGIPVAVLAAALALTLAVSLRRQSRLTRLKNDLIATVSHELKTPLASIRLLIDTLLEGRCRDDVQRKEYLELIARENARLSRLIDNFLTFSRMERNKHAFQFDDCDPGAVVAAAVEATSERFAQPGCRLEVEVDDGLPAVRADADALVTVLVNLLDNAHKYSGVKKEVRLSASARDGAIRFAVEDNGIGIPARARKRIFDRFYQVDQRMSREVGGCGLGLSIVRFIVEAHGGTVRVDSASGNGSIFTVEIPIEPEEARHGR